MTQSTQRIFTVCILVLSLGLGSAACSGTKKASKTKTTEKSVDEPTVQSVQQAQKNFYLMLRLSKDKASNEIKILTVETEVYQKPGNPLPTQSDIDGTQLFTCEIKRENGETIQKQEQKINFTLGDAHNEGILKFILPLPENAHYVEVEHLEKHGAWVKIYSEKL